MIRTIMVALDGSEHAEAAQKHAFYLAECCGGMVIGLHIIDIASIEGSFFHDISGALGFEPYFDFSSKMRDALQERGRGLLDAFAAEASRRGIQAETALGTGIVANEISDHARMADLVVIGHRGVSEGFSTGLLGGTAESVTRKCPKPVFIAPRHFQQCAKPVLAYDGSQRAAAAMKVAAEFCATLQFPLTVLTVQKEAEQARRMLNEASTYLCPYELDVSFESVQASNAPECIATFINEHGYDLLFIGAYGHSRIIEMVLGSTTEYVLRNVSCPVFLNR